MQIMDRHEGGMLLAAQARAEGRNVILAYLKGARVGLRVSQTSASELVQNTLKYPIYREQIAKNITQNNALLERMKRPCK